jgi:hypothetical protein
MGKRQNNPVATRIAVLESRLGFVESQASTPQRGWAARFGRASVIVGCLTGALAGAAAFNGLWQQLNVAPDVRLAFAGDNIEVRWDTQARLLSFDCWLLAENAGRADDYLQARARLTTATGITLAFRQIAMKEQGADAPRPFFRASPGRKTEVRVTLTTSALDANSEQIFREVGLHRLILDFEGPLSHLTQTMTNCFWFGKTTASDLASNGSLPIARDDRCTGSGS